MENIYWIFYYPSFVGRTNTEMQFTIYFNFPLIKGFASATMNIGTFHQVPQIAEMRILMNLFASQHQAAQAKTENPAQLQIQVTEIPTQTQVT
jgi:hypothetical protein